MDRWSAWMIGRHSDGWMCRCFVVLFYSLRVLFIVLMFLFFHRVYRLVFLILCHHHHRLRHHHRRRHHYHPHNRCHHHHIAFLFFFSLSRWSLACVIYKQIASRRYINHPRDIITRLQVQIRTSFLWRSFFVHVLCSSSSLRRSGEDAMTRCF